MQKKDIIIIAVVLVVGFMIAWIIKPTETIVQAPVNHDLENHLKAEILELNAEIDQNKNKINSLSNEIKKDSIIIYTADDHVLDSLRTALFK